MADAETLPLPLYCPLVINGEEGKAASGRKFNRENPADFRQLATVAEEGLTPPGSRSTATSATGFTTTSSASRCCCAPRS